MQFMIGTKSLIKKKEVILNIWRINEIDQIIKTIRLLSLTLLKQNLSSQNFLSPWNPWSIWLSSMNFHWTEKDEHVSNNSKSAYNK
jgi:hypothetical protein